MESRIPRSLLRILYVPAVVACLGLGGFAQKTIDPDPDSPTPILMAAKESSRVLAQSFDEREKIAPTKITARAFDLNSKILLYVSDLHLLKGEGANAFRVYAEDSRGHTYRFPVVDIQPMPGLRNVHAITVLLKDELGYWAPPAADGDVLVYVTWRGLASNEARLGLGTMGGDLRKPVRTRSVTSSPDAAAASRVGDRFRFLEQATFGPTPTMNAMPRQLPLRTWISQQFALAYPTNPYPAQPLKPINKPTDCDGDNSGLNGNPVDIPTTCFWDTYTMYPVQTWNSKEMLYGDAQLRHRVSWALSQIWVTSGVDIQQSRHMVEYHKVLSANAFGNFRDLMGPTTANPSNPGMTLNPTMGDYLSMKDSTRTNPNENYAREIMQLFTIGLFMLNTDGTLQLDGSGNPKPTYDQDVVNNLTKVFTGWNFCQTNTAACPSVGNGNVPTGTVNYIDPLVVTLSTDHDTSAKTLLSYSGSPSTMNIPACSNCTGGTTAVNLANTQVYARNTMIQALDNIFNHPNVGPYISRILIQQMVTSDPTPAYVGRVAAVFNDNGFGVRGDMKPVIQTILLDPEARGNEKTDPNYGKLREPVQFAANILRSFNPRSADGTTQSDGVLTFRSEYTGMGQIPFRSPTVFNYYSPSFVVPGTALNGPEFALMTTGTTIQRANFVNRIVFTVPAFPINLAVNQYTPLGTSVDFTDLQGLVTADPSGNQLLDELNRRMLHNTMSSTMRTTILNSLSPIPSTDTIGIVRQAVYLIATSSQYQVQR